MPLLDKHTYRPPLLLRQKHFNTVYPALFRKLPPVEYERERLELEDGDFLDLDWKRQQRPKLAILLHGLEGNSQAGYIKGIARIFMEEGFDILAMNLRGCSGESNRLFRSYHSGATEDLEATLTHVLEQDRYREIVLAGFSLGGNLVLKFLGEKGAALPQAVKAGFAFSVPCDLEAASDAIGWLYTRVFLHTLIPKLKDKVKQFPNQRISDSIGNIKTIYDFDDLYTGPIHGFLGASDYYHRCSSIHFLKSITVPTLLINSLDDPFLAPACHPFEQAESLQKFYFLAPKFGGHVGFVQFNPEGVYWTEQQVSHFLKEIV